MNAGGDGEKVTGVPRNALSLLAFLAVVAAIVGLLLVRHLLARNPLPVAVQVGAVLLMLWARVTFGARSFHAAASPTEGGLVTHGPYRWWRHPIYAAILYFVWAGQVDAPAALPLGLAAAASLGLFVRMRMEESFLAATYPEYAEYARRTKRVLPYLF